MPTFRAVVGSFADQFTLTKGATPPANKPPIASFDSTADGLTVAFTSTAHDPDGTLVSQVWDFGDGQQPRVHRPLIRTPQRDGTT